MSLINNNNFAVFYGTGIYVSYNKISNISKSISTENLSVGGENHAPRILISPQKNTETITFSGSAGIMQGLPENLVKFDIALPMNFPIFIFVLNPKKEIYKIYYVDEPVLIGKKWSDLHGGESQIFSMDLSFMHRGIIEVPVFREVKDTFKNWFKNR